LNKLGDDVIYVQKISWAEDPGANYFKYLRRPGVTHADYEVVKKRVSSAELTAFYVGIGAKTVKYRTNSASQVFLMGVTNEFSDLFKLEYADGRFFSPSEYHYGATKIVLGYKIADLLFGGSDPIGKVIKITGRPYEVIGVLEKAGESILNVMNFDEAMLISFETARKVANLKTDEFFQNASVCIKAGPKMTVAQLKDETTSAMRAARKLRPREEDNFSLNQLSILASFLDSFFGILNILGVFIGGFATLVGMFSVANIMFVSVKERTRIIGIKKALGAQQYVILLEFLIESVVLCLLGGLAGLLMVIVATTAISQAFDSFKIYLSVNNAVFGIALSTIIGVLAGMIPALQAARMDPVEAMRK
jgi:putative ABC transport system permease protein